VRSSPFFPVWNIVLGSANFEEEIFIGCCVQEITFIRSMQSFSKASLHRRQVKRNSSAKLKLGSSLSSLKNLSLAKSLQNIFGRRR
jgi:hypothetical protein